MLTPQNVLDAITKYKPGFFSSFFNNDSDLNNFFNRLGNFATNWNNLEEQAGYEYEYQEIELHALILEIENHPYTSIKSNSNFINLVKTLRDKDGSEHWDKIHNNFDKHETSFFLKKIDPTLLTDNLIHSITDPNEFRLQWQNKLQLSSDSNQNAYDQWVAVWLENLDQTISARQAFSGFNQMKARTAPFS